MSQSLRRDLELLATFDSDHSDAGNGVVKDFSGKGRHLKASGGPTYGQPSPVGEAVAFDGTDDFFDTGTPLSFETSTIFLVANLAGSNAYEICGNRDFFGDTGEVLIQRGEGTFTFDAGNNAVAVDRVTDEYIRLVCIKDAAEETMKISIIGGETDVGSYTPASGQSNSYKVGVGDGTDTVPGDIAYFGKWSRALSDSEIEELTRMTDRMVSRL